MTHHHTSHVLQPVSPGQAIRRSWSEEHLPASHKAERSFYLRSRSLSTATLIPSTSKLGREVKIRFETSDQRKSRQTEKNFGEEETHHEYERCTRTELRDRRVEITSKSFLNSGVDSESRVKIKMALVQAETPAQMVNDLKEARDVIKKLNRSLQNEKKISAAKDTTIENLRHEISLLDEQLVDKRKENEKYNEEMRKLRSKTTSLETENKILERQVKMINESNKRLHNELHELRGKLRVQETKVGELRVQKSEAFRKYAHLLQTSVDKGTRLRYFLQQLQNEILAQSVTTMKFQIQKEAIENLMQEDSEEDLQFKKYGLISPRKIRKSSYSLSEEEKEGLRRDLQTALVGRHNKLPEKNLPLEKITIATERIVTEGLKTRLGRENEESSHMSRMMQEAKHQIKSLNRIESSHAETSKKLQDKVRTQLGVLEVELKDLSDELKMAQISKREDEEKLHSISKFSTADAKIASVSLARRASQVEKLDLESVIHSMERKNDDSASPMSPRELEILSMKRKMADILEEKLALSDELIESRTNLSNFESLMQSRSLENQKMEKELADKEKIISSTEESLREAQKETLSLKEQLETAKEEAGKRRKEAAQSDGKMRNRAHRVELNFTPSSQPALEQKVETLKEELSAVRRSSITQLNKAIPEFNKVDRGVQVEDQLKTVDKARRERPRVLRRTMSMEMTSSGHVKAQRRISRAEVTLLKRADKEVQVEISSECGLGKIKGTFEREDLTEKLNQENQDLKALLEQQDRDIEELRGELKLLQENKLDLNSSNSEDYPPFNYPKRTSELWKALEEAKKEKEQAEKRNKELGNELQKQEQEIEILIKSLGQQSQRVNSQSQPVENYTTRTMPQSYERSLNGKENIVAENASSPKELVNANEQDLIHHAFVYDSEDGRRILEVQHSGDVYKRARNISVPESVIDSMRKEIQNSKGQSEDLETELFQKDEDLRKAESHIELQKTKLSEMQVLLENMSEEKENIQKDAIEYNNQVTALKILLEETRKERFKTQEEFEQCKSQLAELKESLDRLTTRTGSNDEEYKLEISERKSLLDKTTSENQRTVQELENRDSQVEDLKTSLKDLSKEYRNTEEEIERSQSEITELKRTLDETSQEKHRATEVSERLKSQMVDLQTSLEGSKKILSETTSEISQLKSQLSKTKEEHLETMKEIGRYKSQVSILEASLDTTKQEKLSAEEEIKKKHTEISDLQALLKERKRENEEASENVKRYKLQMEEIENYKSEISDLKVSLDRSKQDGANLTREHELFKFEISDLQGLLEKERTELRGAKEKIEKLESKICGMKSSLRKAQEENQTAANDVQMYKSQILHLTASVEKKRTDNCAATKKIGEYEFEICELKNAARRAHEENHETINDTEDFLEKERAEKQDSVEEIRTYEFEISDLRKSLLEEQDKNQKSANYIEVLKAQISELENSLEEAKQENYKRENENSELKREVNKSGEILQGYRIKEAEIKLENKTLENNNSQLKITVDNLKNQLAGVDNKIKELQIQAEEDKKTISQLLAERPGRERLQEQIKVLELKISERDTNLDQKAEEITKRGERIVRIAQEKEKLEKMIQDVLSVKQNESDHDINDGEMVAKVEPQSAFASPNEPFGEENMQDLQKGLEEFKKQLTTLQVELKEIQREKDDLEETVEQLRNVKNSQDKELELLRLQLQEVESGMLYTERSLERNAELMAEKEKELRELVNEKVTKTSEIESLEASLSNTLQDRDTTLAGKSSDVAKQIVTLALALTQEWKKAFADGLVGLVFAM